MFRSKFFVTTIIFIILLVVTSIVKNQSRIVEKKIFMLNKNISLIEKDINETQLDFYFLSSPEKIEKKLKILGYNNYLPIKNSKIFLNLTNFTDIQNKITTSSHYNEKETKKN